MPEPDDTPREPRRQAERREEAEAALLQAAVVIITRHGAAGLTLAEVGAAAGYSRGLPAHYFGDKQGLLLAIVSYVTKRFATSVARTYAPEPGLETLVTRIFHAYDRTLLQRAGQDADLGAAALQYSLLEALTNPALTQPIAKLNDSSTRTLERDLNTGIERGEIRADADVKAEAAMILGTMRASIMQWVIDPEGTDIIALRDAHCEAMRRDLAA
ncbi:MAG: TetR/AcrR family transcriptional regulator [Pseudomonadota bacterium]|nr:TetR/AcrR family transcriptional regulator [Pseudomonadota bacterium]